jgi:hypothetical protein
MFNDKYTFYFSWCGIKISIFVFILLCYVKKPLKAAIQAAEYIGSTACFHMTKVNIICIQETLNTVWCCRKEKIYRDLYSIIKINRIFYTFHLQTLLQYWL